MQHELDAPANDIALSTDLPGDDEEEDDDDDDDDDDVVEAEVIAARR
jgi:hypothetical protein